MTDGILNPPMNYVARGLILTSLLLPACDRGHEPAPPPATRAAIPASQPVTAATSPVIRPPTRIPSTFVIDGQPYGFPPAKLVLKKTDNGIRATLFSDDPPEALKEDYVGNSFYFDVTFDADSIDELAGQQYDYRNSVGDRTNSTTGIFMTGSKQVLQPVTAAIGFEKSDGRWVALVGGDFQLFDESSQNDGPVMVKVQARLSPTLVDAKP